MVDIEEIYVRDLFEKHNKREEYLGLYSIGKTVYRDDGEVDNENIALDEENLRALKTRIEVLFINEMNPKNNKSPKK